MTIRPLDDGARMSLAPIPFVGATVHYVSYGTPGGEFNKQCRAAVITEIGTPVVGYLNDMALAVLNPTGMFFNTDIPYHDPYDPDPHRPQGLTGGTWHWPQSACDH